MYAGCFILIQNLFGFIHAPVHSYPYCKFIFIIDSFILVAQTCVCSYSSLFDDWFVGKLVSFQMKFPFGGSPWKYDWRYITPSSKSPYSGLTRRTHPELLVRYHREEAMKLVSIVWPPPSAPLNDIMIDTFHQWICWDPVAKVFFALTIECARMYVIYLICIRDDHTHNVE